jgi:serine/threonine-protein phosphatase 4 regulatory subunit 1
MTPLLPFPQIPLFESLRRDPVCHVRHSSLFALPAILSRLSPTRRRALALDSLVPLSEDQSSEVRLGVLEALGEVVYTFHGDQDGPPEKLVALFLGQRDQWPSEGSKCRSSLDASYDHPLRALVCAFNYPAVSLTLGRDRWDVLRDVYLDLADNPDLKVRRTMGASLGELALIIGPDNTRRDLVGVWIDSVRSGDDSVRMRAAECVEVFIRALRGTDVCGTEASQLIVEVLLAAWREGLFRVWREREVIAKALVGLARLMGREQPELFRRLLMEALEDGVGSVREVATFAVCSTFTGFRQQLNMLCRPRSPPSTKFWETSQMAYAMTS